MTSPIKTPPRVSTASAPLSFPRVPLKEMDAAMLGFELTRELELHLPDAGDRTMVTSAAMLATHLHRNQTRRVRANMPRVPYIEHPLRNALRVVRWGGAERDLLAATLLHDTVEDCADEIVEQFAADHPLAGEGADAHTVALAWMGEQFSPSVARSVELVTNAPGSTRADYLGHMDELVELARRHGEGSPEFAALVVKGSDLVDNAGSLGHQYTPGNNERQTVSLAQKYLPAIEVIAPALMRSTDVCAKEAGRSLQKVEHSVHGLLNHIDTLERQAGGRLQRSSFAAPDPEVDLDLG